MCLRRLRFRCGSRNSVSVRTRWGRLQGSTRKRGRRSRCRGYPVLDTSIVQIRRVYPDTLLRSLSDFLLDFPRMPPTLWMTSLIISYSPLRSLSHPNQYHSIHHLANVPPPIPLSSSSLPFLIHPTPHPFQSSFACPASSARLRDP